MGPSAPTGYWAWGPAPPPPPPGLGACLGLISPRGQDRWGCRSRPRVLAWGRGSDPLALPERGSNYRSGVSRAWTGSFPLKRVDRQTSTSWVFWELSRAPARAWAHSRNLVSGGRGPSWPGVWTEAAWAEVPHGGGCSALLLVSAPRLALLRPPGPAPHSTPAWPCPQRLCSARPQPGLPRFASSFHWTWAPRGSQCFLERLPQEAESPPPHFLCSQNWQGVCWGHGPPQAACAAGRAQGLGFPTTNRPNLPSPAGPKDLRANSPRPFPQFQSLPERTTGPLQNPCDSMTHFWLHLCAPLSQEAGAQARPRGGEGGLQARVGEC